MKDDGERHSGLGGRLAGPVRTVWAKHDRDTDGWLPLWRHMDDSAAVAGLLWDNWVPSSLRGLIAESLPGGEADARCLVVWLAAVHDIGKATPAFACQVDQLADRMRAEGLEMRTARAFGPDRRMAPHGLAGHLLLSEWLASHGWTGRQSGQFTIVVGGHHGVPPDHGQIKALDDRPYLLRTPGPSRPLWQRVQDELLDACADEYGVRGRLAEWRTARLPQPVQVLLTALVIIADWVASNPALFPYFPEESPRSGKARVAAAWRGLRLPPPWRPDVPGGGDVQELFASRFELPEGAKVRPVQAAAVRLAREMPEPGLLMVEAPMGEGKTEAALAVAEIFAARAGAGGVFFALPTMATGNAMFPRLLDWLERLPAEGGARVSVLLAHSKAALNEEYADLMRESRQSITAVDSDAVFEEWRPSHPTRAAAAELVAHEWLRGRKKGMLSSFVAGTVDQLLFAGLKSRHLALRHLAVAGKVIVIDEAHAYDTYMSAYLDRVLSWLGEYRVPVVVLSATLPAARRRQLAEAYAGVGEESAAFDVLGQTSAYPLLTAVAPGREPVVEQPGASARGGAIQVERLDDDLDVLADRLATELDGGGCALVVRNTVKRVLDAARVLRERFGDEHVTVAHSCFIDVDRAAKDADLLKRFGPPGKATGRPGTHIVVASQVAEQSLDVDFDLLITDLCPIDLLLQRVGRLHRHQRGEAQDARPERLRTARCLVTGVDWDAGVPSPVRGSVAVYGAHMLLRSAAVLLPHLDTEDQPIRLPQDISPLVQEAYADAAAGPAEWADAMAKARDAYSEHRADQASRADTFLLAPASRPGRPLIGWVAAGAGDADDSRAGRAQVRDSRESLEVIVVQRLDDGSLATVPWLADGKAGLELPQDRVPSPKAARAAATCGLRLPIQFSYADVMDKAIAALEELYVPAWQVKESHWLAGQLILALDADCQTHLAGFQLHYSERDGLEVTRA